MNTIYKYLLIAGLILAPIVYLKVENIRLTSTNKELNNKIRLEEYKNKALNVENTIINEAINNQNSKIEQLSLKNKEIQADKERILKLISKIKKDNDLVVSDLKNKSLQDKSKACEEANKLFNEYSK